MSKEIGGYFGIVSGILRAIEGKRDGEIKIREEIEHLKEKFINEF